MTDNQHRPLGLAICQRLTDEIGRLGFPDPSAPVYDQACFESEKDPYSGETTLCGRWLNGYGHSIGEIKFHGDGSFYAEYDVALPHPTDRRWFVEGVVAWGKGDKINSEPKLLAALGE